MSIFLGPDQGPAGPTGATGPEAEVIDGSLYEDSTPGSTLTVTTGDNYYKWSTFVENGHHGLILDDATDTITVPTGAARHYCVGFSVSMYGPTIKKFMQKSTLMTSRR